jgi:hypothetical protein
VPVAAGPVGDPYAVPQADLYAPSPANGDRYGACVAISGDTAVVGAPQDDLVSMVAMLPDAGRVYVYVRSGETWTLQAELVSPQVEAGAQFGKSVAIQGDTIVVGEPYQNVSTYDDAGRAYVFQRTGTTWSSGYALAPQTDHDSDWFGMAVDIDGDRIVVGAPNDDTQDEGLNNGRIYVYDRLTGGVWFRRTETLVDVSADQDDRLGSVVAISGTTIMTNAGDEPDLGFKAVLPFELVGTTWAPVDSERLSAPSPAVGDGFGGPIALEGNTVIVGSMERTIGTIDYAGSAYVFRDPGTGWAYTQTLTSPVPTSQEMYGSGVALSGNRALIGAFWGDEHNGEAFSYTWNGSTFDYKQKLSKRGHYPYVTHFGSSVALDGATAVVGGTLSDAYDTGNVVQDEAGAAHVFTFTGGLVSGICKNALTGVPLAGVEVGAYYPDAFGDPETEQYVTTGADGKYSLAVNPGTFSIGYMGPSSAYYPGWYNHVGGWPDSTPIAVATASSTTINFDIYPKLAVYRFYNFTNGTHFFTDSLAEADHVLATWPHIYQYEGVAYYVDRGTDTQPLYPFYKPSSTSHFYTASLDEANHVLATWPNIYSYDGPPYAVAPAPAAGKIPVYRFYNLRNGSHFYTASLDEANHVILTWPDVYQFEGPAFWIGG